MTPSQRTVNLPVGLAPFTLVYLVVCSGLAWRQGNAEFMIYAGAMVVFIATVLVLHRHARFSAAVLWLLSLWGLVHMLGGTVPIDERFAETDSSRHVLYALRLHPWLPRYDQLVHAFGFFGATAACWEACRAMLRVRPGVALSVVALLMGTGLGALNEVIEFGITLVMPDNGVGGYVNTGWDLVSNLIGATAAAVWCLGRR
jgi:uncharacterized membrane protein YjdF